jgi:Phosphoenolpyruvate synthase/pyruvate phosphate dikinase
VGTKSGTEVLKDGQEVTVDCSQGQTGFIYFGLLEFEVLDTPIGGFATENVKAGVLVGQLAQEGYKVSMFGGRLAIEGESKNHKCEIMLNIADPARAFVTSFLPNNGVGLARIEFIINSVIKIHPMALVKPKLVKDSEILEKINYLTRAYKNTYKNTYKSKCEFFVDNLACGIGNIAAAFYPKPVIVRLSDFKTNEYRNLIGGKYFEPEEENPMIGWRGASRYYDKNYSPAFALECQAIKKCREVMGLSNIKVMIPFVRTLKEAELVLCELEKNGLKKGDSGLEIIMMCEIPSNVILIEEFCKFFDGFSIGSNDLTQLTLGVDRDSGILSKLFDESDPAVMKMMGMAIEGAKKHGKHIGICGQAPSDLPEIAKFLILAGISSISLNPDSLGQFLTQFK